MSTDVVCISPIQANATEVEQGRLKAELRSLRRKGARNALGEELSQGRSCARCKTQLGRIYNTGASCPRCRHRVCRQCREYRGSTGTEWLCLVCHKIAEIQTVSGEWMNEASGTKRGGRRKFLPSPADILKRSIRRSWTINGPPASWCAVRGSPEFRAYQSLPRHQDYFEVEDRPELVIPEQSLNDRKSREIFIEDSQIPQEKIAIDLPLVDENAKSELKPKESTPKLLKNDARCSANNDESPSSHSQDTSNNTSRVSQIKPPRIHAKFNFPETKHSPTPPKSVERKSNIPILRRSSKEFEDIRSPLESVKRSLIPQRYRGSTDDLRRSREDITEGRSQIPKLFSPRVKDERLKRQDSKDEIRFGGKLSISRKEDRKEISLGKSCGTGSIFTDNNRVLELKSGIKIFRRELGVDSCPREGSPYKLTNNKFGQREEKGVEKVEDSYIEDESKSKLTAKQETCENVKQGDECAKGLEFLDDSETNLCSSGNDCEEFLTPVKDAGEMVEEREPQIVKNERDIEGLIQNQNQNDNDNENEGLAGVAHPKNKMENGGVGRENPPDLLEDEIDAVDKKNPKLGSGDGDKEEEEEKEKEKEKEAHDVADSSLPKKLQIEDSQVVARRKFSKEEFSNPDDTDEVPNRRSSSHLSPEASPLSTRSSRYSPRESESEPTPALPRKTGESSSASQRVRDAITRTRRESNSSTRYESSGSESIRLSGGVETRRVRFGGGSGIEEVQRDSATSAGEDEPRNSIHNPGGQRDSRTTAGALQARAVRRRRQFDTQGSRRRGRSHARGSGEDFHHLQQAIGRGCLGGGQHSPPQGGGQSLGQDQPIIDYRRLVFISSDSSSGREEDDADSSSGSSSLNGAPRSSLAQGLEDCDWDYFESGGSVPPLPHLQVGIVGGAHGSSHSLNSGAPHIPGESHRGHPGISLSSQDWSCCPGRGSSACQACGGARGANVFPVPVPIPVPVPYPVPVPASLWTSSLTNTSMINCASAELGALQLSRGGGTTSQFHPAAAQWFAWPPRFVHEVGNNPRSVNDLNQSSYLDARSREAAAAAAAAAAATFAFHQARELGQINLQCCELPGAKEEPVGDIVKDEVPVVEIKVRKDVAPEDEEDSTSDCSDEEVTLPVEPVPSFENTNSPNTQRKTSSKMYRLSQGNSGSSSGRSSADSSDLEDSASHHFSRVFVVNDDSSTSDNEQEDVEEDVEDSDSNGITLRRVTALPEDGPVVLRHVKFLDEDRTTEKKNEPPKSPGSKNETNKDTIRFKYLRNFDPEANEIYLVDSKEDDAEHRIELKSVKSIDPDLIDEPKINKSADTADPDSLMPEIVTDSSIIVPDSLEIGNSEPVERSSTKSNEYESGDGVTDTGDICGLRTPGANFSSDKKRDRDNEQPVTLSEIYDDTATSCDAMLSLTDSVKNPDTSESRSSNYNTNLNLTGGSEQSSETTTTTNTGSEVSSDELHEYEITAWSSSRDPEEDYDVDEASAYGAVNEELVLSRSLLNSDKKLVISEGETSDGGLYSENLTINNKNNNDNISGFTSDDFSTDEGGSSRLDSGVATGVEDTNASGRTDDGSTQSFETTPGESIELVHSPLGTSTNEERCCEEDSENREEKSSPKFVKDDDGVEEKSKSVDAKPEEEEKGKDDSVNDLISIKIHEIFKSVESRGVEKKFEDDKYVGRIKRDAKPSSEEEEESGVLVSSVGERTGTDSKQVEGGSELAARAEVSSVERRPPVDKDGLCGTGLASTVHRENTGKTSTGLHGNRYKSLVMITQGAYQPVNVVTSDTTTLLQPDESPPPPRGLAGYFHLALETAAELPSRNGTSGPRRPPTVKRPAAQNRIVNIEPEVDSGLSVGSASESDDVQSVKSASKVAVTSGLDHSASSSGTDSGVSVDKSPNETRARSIEATGSSGVVVILEEGLADDDSWVEEVSHDEDEQGATTATEESSEDEANNLGDREEELRGYHRQAIDFTLHTIVEESCEESEAEPSSMAVGSPRKQRPPSASELEKYFFFGLGEGVGNGAGSREIDSLSETSSIYSEGLESLGQDEPGQNTEKNSPDYLSSSSRLEKYFLSDFLGFDRDRRDSDGSVGSDSEGRPSPEQRRKRLVRARGTGRSHSSSLDNLLALTQSSANLSSQNSLQDLSLNPDSQETQSEGSSTETDGADDQMPAFGTDGQFDTVKRKKKKPRNLGTQSPRISDDRNKTPEPAMIEADGDLLEAVNSEDDRAKTPQPDVASQSTESNRVKQTLQASDSAHSTGRSKQQQSESGRSNGGGSGSDVNLARSKQHSRDSGFIGSCDDLLQHQRVSGSNDAQNSNGGTDSGKKDSHHERRSGNDAKHKEGASAKIEQSVSQATLPPPNASLSRKDSFNNWSSDEETNLMMSKMRQFFKTMVANSNNGHNSNNSSAASPAPSPRLPGSSPRSRIVNQNRTKPPQLVYFENELTRLMKTVPGIRDEQVKEIVEYLSSEDTWSDSYDSSDYTSSDLECAGGRRSALQEQISQSCQQIISKFDTTGAAESTLASKEAVPSTQSAQPLSCRDTAFVYQKLVQSFTKMTGDGVSSDASSTPHSSPPLIAKVMHHIGSRLVALMHEVSEGGPAVQPSAWRRYPHHRTPSSASTTEDDDSTSDSANTPAQHQLPRSKSHDPLLLLNGHPTAGYQEGEEREASDNERFSWRGSFESALMPADSRTKLSLLACSGDVSASASALAMAAKRRSAGDLLFNPKSLSREQLDRVRSCGSIGGGSASVEDKIWSNRRRSSVPDANTRGESGASAGDEDTEDELEYGGDSRATTLPRGLQTAATATNSLPRLPAVSPTSGPVTMHKAHSVHHFLQQHNNVKSARYRPPGFARNNLTGGATGGPKRAVSAPGLQLPAGSNGPAGKRETARSRRQAVSLTPDDGSSLLEACSTPIIGGVRGGSLSNDDEMDRSLHTSLLGNRGASSSSLGARSDSMASVYSGAGEGRWCGSVAVRGEVEFALEYDQKQKTFEVRVTQCRDLAPVDVKRNRSDPYVKVYLLPDKSKGGKRKTKVKKHTLNPVFDETLKFHISLNGLETRTLWLTVWHSDMFGRNDFLGEVRMALENKIFDDLTPRWYPLQERSEPFDDPITCKGEVIVGLKFVPPDPTQQHERPGDRTGTGEKIGIKTRKAWSKGALHVLVKEARNLQTRAKHGGTCDPFCKSYLLPDKGRSGKQKTGVVRKCTGGSPVWGHTFVYKDVSLQELAERGLELTVWDHDRIASNEFLGGVRFNLGTGKHYGKAVEWMDATGRELSLWQNMLERPNFWVEGAVTLRPNLHNHPRNNTT